MDSEGHRIGRGFWVRWMMLTAVGLFLGFLAGFVLGHVLLGNVSVGIGVGAGVGFFQWLILRRYIFNSAWWIPAGMIGLFVTLGLFAITWIVWGVPFDMGWPMGGLGWAVAFLVGGALTGWIQLPVLRRRIDRPGSWVLFSAIGWCLSVFPMIFLQILAGTAIGGIVLGCVTGGALQRLLSRQTVGE